MASQTDPRLGTRSRVGFNGQLHEFLEGWQLLGNGYRSYSPTLMRFHSADDLSPFGKGGANAYAYCSGDPLNRVDPTGHHWIGWAAVSGLLVVGAGAATGASLVGDRGVQGVFATVAALSLAGVAVGFAGYTRLGNKVMDKVFMAPPPTASAPPLSPSMATRLHRPIVPPPQPPAHVPISPTAQVPIPSRASGQVWADEWGGRVAVSRRMVEEESVDFMTVQFRQPQFASVSEVAKSKAPLPTMLGRKTPTYRAAIARDSTHVQFFRTSSQMSSVRARDVPAWRAKRDLERRMHMLRMSAR